MNFNTTKYKVWTWKHPLMLHWILNPGIAVNELILGQRIPKVTLVEKENKAPLGERTFIPCPHCNTIHSSLKWTSQNKTAFKNWFGLYCDNCGKIIPCLTNLTTYIILGVTFPVWIWFRKRWKQKWLQIQKEKFSKPLILLPEYNVASGLNWGLFMFFCLDILFPLIEGERLNIYKLCFGIIYWVLFGLAWSYMMKKFFIRQQRKQATAMQSKSISE
jgi:hypothetical protein